MRYPREVLDRPMVPTVRSASNKYVLIGILGGKEEEEEEEKGGREVEEEEEEEEKEEEKEKIYNN